MVVLRYFVTQLVEKLRRWKQLARLNRQIAKGRDQRLDPEQNQTLRSSMQSHVVEARNRAYYDQYGKHYEEYHAYFRNTVALRQWKRNLESIKEALPLGQVYRAVDFGCGTGLLTFMLLDLGFSVTAVDISEVMLRQLRRKAYQLQPEAAGRIQYVHGGMEEMVGLPDSAYSLVCASSVMHHLEDCNRFLTEAAKLLHPQGIAYIGREPLITCEQHHSPFNMPLYMLISLMDMTFDAVQSHGQFEEVFDETIQPQWGKGGVSCDSFIRTGQDLGFEVLFQQVYNWHRSKQAFAFDKMLPRALRYERLWGTFFDLALQRTR